MGLEPIRTTTYLGRAFVYPAESLIGNSIQRGLAWDEVVYAIVQELPEDSPLVCDVGSNIGASLMQIVAARPRARVLAFEASERFRPLLERNVKLAGLKAVEVIPLLLGRTSGTVALHNNGTSASLVSAAYDGHEPRGTQMAQMTTLDEVLRSRGPVHFIKIDTDGFDFEVLRGAEQVLKRDRPVLFFELAAYLSKNVEAEIAWLQDLGYRRLTCFAPSPFNHLIGSTEDPKEATRWARANRYCDVLACSQTSGLALPRRPEGSWQEYIGRGFAAGR
jgi:FkbM family methyltransferase